MKKSISATKSADEEQFLKALDLRNQCREYLAAPGLKETDRRYYEMLCYVARLMQEFLDARKPSPATLLGVLESRKHLPLAVRAKDNSEDIVKFNETHLVAWDEELGDDLDDLHCDLVEVRQTASAVVSLISRGSLNGSLDALYAKLSALFGHQILNMAPELAVRAEGAF